MAKEYGVSRQTLATYLNRKDQQIEAIIENLCVWREFNRSFQEVNVMDYTMRMDFMCEEKCCTQILIGFRHEKVEIKNTTDKIMLRAFGININPTWEDFLEFLEERCFPRTRDNLKVILQDLNLDFYDPWNIVEKTQGHMGEDMQWLQDGYWYKADQFGYESLAEVVASHLLGQSSIKEAAVYEPVVILYKGK